jgi:hypothetical protein
MPLFSWPPRSCTTLRMSTVGWALVACAVHRARRWVPFDNNKFGQGFGGTREGPFFESQDLKGVVVRPGSTPHFNHTFVTLDARFLYTHSFIS